MTHLELENLASEYLEGQLDTARRGQVETHLGECASCRELMDDLRRVMELCRSAEELEPAPWLIPKILRATVGERKPTLGEQLAAFLRPSGQPRLAYAVAMAIFSFSIIVNAAGLDLRKLTLADLNPRTWFYEANRTGHLLFARAEKFYYDLRVVYEIESRFRQLRSRPGEQKEQPKPETPPGGSTDRGTPSGTQLAVVSGWVSAAAGSLGVASETVGKKRSPSP
ncbi:MAG: zf-HC2 domain-containing protein [Acidobacteriia bacterium]|nr:zf-HC2 domain-containing protein [Terriglobia bacterium]